MAEGCWASETLSSSVSLTGSAVDATFSGYPSFMGEVLPYFFFLIESILGKGEARSNSYLNSHKPL